MKNIIEKITKRINSKKYRIEKLEELILNYEIKENKNKLSISSLNKEIENLNGILKSSNDTIANQNTKIVYLKEKLSLKKITENDLFSKIEELKKELKKINGTKGGLTKENNKLKLENENLKLAIVKLKDDLTDAMSDKYLRKEIPSGKRPKTQFVCAKQIRSKQVNGILKEINESKNNNED